MSGAQLETEVKFLLADLSGFRRRLLAAGGVLKQARTHERNVVFDTPEKQLMRQGKLLRLRQDQAVRLTFKGGSGRRPDQRSKSS
ncbi:MAG: CYTH domain-containing protein [Chloroflexi bacterium]|nr:CYTH domain-containing protein [Chloroflexota bacterium]